MNERTITIKNELTTERTKRTQDIHTERTK